MVSQCLKYLYIRNSLVEIKVAAATIEIEELLPIMVEYVEDDINNFVWR